MDLWPVVSASRLALADDLDGLSEQQWETPSLCGDWEVRDVLAHLVWPHLPHVGRRLIGPMVQARGNFDRANRIATARLRARPPADLVADLRRYAGSRFSPPVTGPIAQFTDTLVHGADIRIPLGITDRNPVEPWGASLDFAFTRKARMGFVSHWPPPDLRYQATDLAWSHGPSSAPSAPEVRGPAASLALALFGRPVGLDSLEGPGVEALRTWVRQ